MTTFLAILCIIIAIAQPPGVEEVLWCIASALFFIANACGGIRRGKDLSS